MFQQTFNIQWLSFTNLNLFRQRLFASNSGFHFTSFKKSLKCFSSIWIQTLFSVCFLQTCKTSSCQTTFEKFTHQARHVQGEQKRHNHVQLPSLRDIFVSKIFESGSVSEIWVEMYLEPTLTSMAEHWCKNS